MTKTQRSNEELEKKTMILCRVECGIWPWVLSKEISVSAHQVWLKSKLLIHGRLAKWIYSLSKFDRFLAKILNKVARIGERIPDMLYSCPRIQANKILPTFIFDTFCMAVNIGPL